MTSLWRLRLPVRSFHLPTCSVAARRFNSTKTSDPLRILFCGSDDFSIASLKALHNEQLQNPAAIASIDVVHRPGKFTGRGLKELREVPIKRVAKELKLARHEIDTFTGWEPPSPQNEAINLVIAVSFGKLVPPRILNGAKYGGLNVHPSLLPDLHGPAPIHHTLLRNLLRTGVTVQTLHPEHFDQGQILAQTPAPGLAIPNGTNCTPTQLTQFLAPIGGQMLIDVLKAKKYVQPLEDAGWYGKDGTSAEIHHAPLITKEMGRIPWNAWSAAELFTRKKVLESLWTTVTVQGDGGAEEKRLVVSGLKEIREPDNASTRVGEFFAAKAPEGMKIDNEVVDPEREFPCVRTKDGAFVLITKSTVEGGKKNKGGDVVLANLGVQGKKSWW